MGGKLQIGEGCYFGLGACIREELEIGAHSVIGMGAVVLNDVEEGTVVVGNPAKFLRKNKTGRVFKK